ncbi:transposase InsO family protein [Paenochrobactrum gallinarii]|uniref:Transposase InsO family protein n=1 Tax=Paenochrobactrum gallinarii TaxID=643673 RepID=A0A841M1R0_9HYPH|nr:transposase InsO family protein [Paenochrobactrum gallinarii]
MLKGIGIDNAMVETVFKTIKSEMVWGTSLQTRADAVKALGRYIDCFKNPIRRHSALGYKLPIAFVANSLVDLVRIYDALHQEK